MESGTALLFRLVTIVAFGIACVSVAKADGVYRDGTFEFEIAPVAAWVKAPLAYPEVDTSRPVPGGLAFLMLDTQYRIDPAPSIFRRTVVAPIDATGLQAVSHLQVEFNPSFNHLTLHDITIIRNGVRTNRLEAKSVRLIQRERDLEKAIYDGTVTATLVLDDVQIGDVIDYAYTVDGTNPFWPKATSSILSAAAGAPIGLARARLVADAGRSIRVKSMATSAVMARAEKDGSQEWSWEQRNVPAIDLVLDAPARIPQLPTFQFSEMDSWKSVVEWALPLFPGSKELSPELQQRVDAWLTREQDPSRRALIALRYVQDDIRYFGIELGTGSLVPREANETARSGFGDCKDKSILLIALLRAMRIDATPALAARRFGSILGEMLPSPKLFDHMIVGVRIGGDRFWLDPTVSLQGGDLRASSVRTYGYLLPIESGAANLVKLDPAEGGSNAIERVETFTLSAWGKPADLTIETRYTGSIANFIRALAAQVKADAMDQAQLTQIQRRYKEATQVQATRIVDDRSKNEMRVASRFTVPGLVEHVDNKNGIVVLGFGLVDVMPKAGPRVRRLPYALSYPLEQRHRTVIDFPADIKTAPVETHRVRDKYFVFDSRLESSGRRLTYDASWKSERDAVEADDWPAYLAKNDEMRRYLAFVYDPEPPQRAGLLGRLFGDDKYVHDHREKREAIEKLTTTILSGRLGGDALAEAYRNRGVRYSDLNLLDEALFDLNKSVSLRPNDAGTLVDRGLVLTSSRRYDDALQDYGRALEIDPLNGRFRYLRGISNFHAQRFDMAAADLRAAVDGMGPGDGSYALLWLYLATWRAGGDAADLAGKYVQKTDGSSWPAAIVRYYGGTLPQSGVFSAAATGDIKTRLFNTCEADYFVGAFALAHNDPVTAREFFEKARATDVREYLEWVASGIELDRMK